MGWDLYANKCIAWYRQILKAGPCQAAPSTTSLIKPKKIFASRWRPLGGSAVNGMSDKPKIAVLHVMLNPLTGPWNVMRQLCMAQQDALLYSEVALGLITDSSWPAAYEEELKDLSIRAYRRRTFRIFGTAQQLLQFVFRPGIERWVEDLAARSGAGRVIVHFHNSWISGVFLPLRSKQVSLTSVATFHGMTAQLNGRPVRRWLHRWMASRLPRYGAWLTSVDAANLGLADTVLRLNPKLFRLVANGVADMPHVRCSEWLNEGEFRVGHVGSITERKGWRLAADAVLRLRAEGLNVRLLIAGLGPEEDQVQAMAREHPEAIEFLGHVTNPRSNLLPRLHALSIMSVHEGLPMTLIEAMSVGLPVVATDVGGIPEAVTNNKTGLLIPRKSEELAEAIRTLYQSPEKCSRLGMASRAEFERRFELRHIVKEYDAVYSGAFAS